MGQVGRAVTPLSCSELCPHPRGQDMAQRLGAGLGAKLMCARTAPAPPNRHWPALLRCSGEIFLQAPKFIC